jgi:hypothetical protein
LEVNPGNGTPIGSGRWPQPVGATIFPGGVRRLPRATKSPRLTVLRCAAVAGDAARPAIAFCFTDKAAMGATL